MNNKLDRQTQAVAEAIYSYFLDQGGVIHEIDANNRFAVDGMYLADDLAQAAIAASDAKYVPMLVEALKIADLAFRNGSVGPNAEKEKARVLRAAHKKILRALSQLPEDLR